MRSHESMSNWHISQSQHKKLGQVVADRQVPCADTSCPWWGGTHGQFPCVPPAPAPAGHAGTAPSSSCGCHCVYQTAGIDRTGIFSADGTKSEWCFRTQYCTVIQHYCIMDNTGPRTKPTNEMNFGMNHAPSAGSIARLVDMQSSVLPLAMIEPASKDTWSLV